TPFSCAAISCVSDIEPLIDYRHVRYSHNGLGSKTGGAAARAVDHAAAHKPHSGVEQQVSSVAVILGTGSIVATRNRNYQIVRAGGWGPNLGDECSGGAFGIAALRSVTEWLDVGGPLDQAPPLVAAVLAALPGRDEWQPSDGTLNRDRLSGVLIETAANRTSAAMLAHIVLELALEKKDADALRLMKTHLELLSWEIEQVVHRAGLDPAGFELVFSGGLASNYAALREALVEACRARGLYPRDSVVAEPLLAALRLALAGACQE
ncbi:MAG: BadF/BadG/BcrA/BcrD ATPase family protein, partial [Aureliella sp.]